MCRNDIATLPLSRCLHQNRMTQTTLLPTHDLVLEAAAQVVESFCENTAHGIVLDLLLL